MDYILTWSMGKGSVSSGDYLFDIDTKPELNFEFNCLYYEPATGLSFKLVGVEPDEIKLDLSLEEIQICQRYCDDFLTNQDYLVQAYDRETKIFIKTMLKSNAEKQGLSYTLLPPPDYPVSRLTGSQWEQIIVTFTESGYYTIYPDSYCSSCILFLNKEEWDNWPKPSKNTEIWSFREEKWVESRTLKEAKSNADFFIRSVMNQKRKDLLGDIPMLESTTWPIQVREALAYRKNNLATTPFIDGMIIGLEDAVKKVDLVNKILEHISIDFLKELGKIHGQIYKYLYQVKNCTSIDQVDDITNQVANLFSIEPLVTKISIS